MIRASKARACAPILRRSERVRASRRALSLAQVLCAGSAHPQLRLVRAHQPYLLPSDAKSSVNFHRRSASGLEKADRDDAEKCCFPCFFQISLKWVTRRFGSRDQTNELAGEK